MNDYVIMVLSLFIAAGLGCIPASIAKQKGYSFGLWWLYGWLLFLVALIHICVLPNKKSQNILIGNMNAVQTKDNQNAVEELKKYKELLNQGIITEEEFQKTKKKLLELI